MLYMHISFVASRERPMKKPASEISPIQGMPKIDSVSTGKKVLTQCEKVLRHSFINTCNDLTPPINMHL